MKRLLRGALANRLEAQLSEELTSFVQSTRTADFAEAVDAFLSKRAPHFRGR
jgi:2-(1,2-epoxy-1,2-dihydrophenyl)acetyl-CoA isomerase